ncbi:unnamed protein product [Calypogeia fissa]
MLLVVQGGRQGDRQIDREAAAGKTVGEAAAAVSAAGRSGCSRQAAASAAAAGRHFVEVRCLIINGGSTVGTFLLSKRLMKGGPSFCLRVGCLLQDGREGEGAREWERQGERERSWKRTVGKKRVVAIRERGD